MANTFKIKRGDGAPSNAAIDNYELVYDYTNNDLWTKHSGSVVKVASGNVGTVTNVVAGTGLSGGGTSTATLNVDAAQTQITSIGTIGTGVWNGTAIASAYLDADTAHLSTTQTFSGAKTFSGGLAVSSSGGFTIGNVAGVARIQEGSNEFSFLTTGNAYANIYTNDIIANGKIIHYGDTNTYMQFSAADTWKVYAGGQNPLTAIANRVYINAAGANGLLINNDEGNSADSARIFFEGTNTSCIMQQGADLSFRSGATTGSSSGTERMKVDTSGVAVVGALTTTGGVALAGELDFTGNGNKIIDIYTLASSNTFRIRHHNPSGNVFHDALVLTGNAGAKLYYNNGLRFETTNTGATLTGGTLDIPNTGDWSYIKNNTNSGGLRFGTKDSGGTFANQIEISNTGNYVKLNENTTVTGQLTATTTIHSNTGFTTDYGIRFNNGATDFMFYNNTNDNIFYLRDLTNAQMLQSWTPSSTTIHKPLYVTGTLAVTSQINLTNSGSATMVGLKGTNWGYSSGYKALQIGNTSGTYSIALGYDPSTNANANFTGDGREIIFRNGAEFLTPNAANNAWHNDVLVLKDGKVGISTSSPSYTLSVTGTIGSTGAITANNGKPVLTENGSWIGDLGSNGYTRTFTYDVSSGPMSWIIKGGQMSTIVDGSHFAYEANTTGGGGFWSSYDSSYGNACGIKASGTSELIVKQVDGGACDLKLTSHLVLPYGQIHDDGTDVVVQATNAFVAQTGGANNRYIISNSGNHTFYGNASFSSPISSNYGPTFNEGGNDSDTRIESVGNANFFRLDASTNRLGIGTGSPADLFHVYDSGNATVRIQGAGGQAAIRYQNDAQSWYTGINSSEQYYWYSSQLGGTTNMIHVNGDFYTYYDFLISNNNRALEGRDTSGAIRTLAKIDSSNRVILGDASLAGDTYMYPSTRLRIYSDAGYLELGAMNSSWGHIQTDRNKFYFNKQITVDTGIITAYDENLSLRRQHDNTHDRIDIEASAQRFTIDATDRMVLTSSGLQLPDNVRVGNGSESAPSLSFGNDTDTGIYRRTTNQIGFSCANHDQFYVSDGMIFIEQPVRIQFANDQRIYDNGSGGLNVGAQANELKLYCGGPDPIQFMSGGRSGTVRMTMLSTGLFGIGTATPQALLDLSAHTSTTSDGDGTAGMAIGGADSILLEGHNGGASGSNYGSITWAGGSRRRAMITAVADGSTDTDIIGLSFYTQGTDGSGDFFESMRIAHNGNVHFDKDVIAYSSTPSDVRLKKNFEKIENGLDVVNKLEGHTFNWKKGGDRLSAGFKAQEVEKILPHLVDEKRLPLHSDDDKEYKILRYEEMIPYLVEAIKEQQVQINELKTQIGE